MFKVESWIHDCNLVEKRGLSKLGAMAYAWGHICSLIHHSDYGLSYDAPTSYLVMNDKNEVVFRLDVRLRNRDTRFVDLSITDGGSYEEVQLPVAKCKCGMR